MDTTAIKLPPASHTFHQSWSQCPRKSWHSYIARDIERRDSKELAWGRHVHEAMDRYLTKGEPLPAELMIYEHLYQFPRDGYLVYSEVQLGVHENGSPCKFWDPDVYARGVIDVLVLVPHRPDTAIIIDHKTGKVREDPAELLFHAALLKANYAPLKNIKGWYNWLQPNRMGQVHDLSDTEETFRSLLAIHKQIEYAFRLGDKAFPPKQGPLCPWCPCTFCEFHP